MRHARWCQVLLGGPYAPARVNLVAMCGRMLHACMQPAGSRRTTREGHLPFRTHARWEDFQAFVDEREPKMLRAFTAMEVNPAGQLELKHIKSAPRLSANRTTSSC